METVIGQKYLCPVVEVDRSGGGLFYVVDLNGVQCRVKAFEYQKGRPTPVAVQCVLQGHTPDGAPVIAQDVAAAVKALYAVDGVYDFKVKSTNAHGGYYEVVDRNGFIMHLADDGQARFYVNQIVPARVAAIDQARVELVREATAHHEGLTFLPPEQVLALDSEQAVPQSRLKALFWKADILAQARDQYEDGNAMWLVTAVTAIDSNLSEWLTAARFNTLDVLRSVRSICVNVLERSDYLTQCSPAERADYEHRFVEALQNADDHIEALTLMRADASGRAARTFVNDCMERLKHTGYLYQPEQKMRVLMSLFILRRESLHDSIEEIFAVIRDSHSNERFMQQFKGAFIDMLNIYIRHERKTVDLITGTDDAQATRATYQMVEALALQLLLVDQEEFADYTLYRSMLYRYASLVVPLQADALLSLACSALFGWQDSPLEYGWADFANLPVLCAKLATTAPASVATGALHHHGEEATLVVDPGSIRLLPRVQGDNMKRAYAEEITPWHHLQVMLASSLPGDHVAPSERNIDRYGEMWRRVERALTVGEQATAVRQRTTPDVGDSFLLRVLRPVPGRKYDLYCQIEDEAYTGMGILDTHRLVHYNVVANVNLFRDTATGNPLLLRASVESIDDQGVMHFTMLDKIAQFVKQDLSPGEEVNALVSYATKQQFICITELGFSLAINISDNPDLKLGQFIWAQIRSLEDNGNVYAEFVEMSNKRFNTDDAFFKLVTAYADDIYTPEEEPAADDEEAVDSAAQSDGYIEAETVMELTRIIDRLAMTRGDHVATFNYLAYARLICRIVGNNDQPAYYDRRMELVRALQQFGEFGRITDDELNALLAAGEQLADNYPEIKSRLQQLRIINSLDKPWHDDDLWRIAGHDHNTTTSSLARLVLSYNMLRDFNVYDQLQAVRRRIYQLMDLEMELPTTAFVANEDQFTELKASMIFPAGNAMQPNEVLQMHELLTVVCAFLNAKGGTLYVGVNNQGMAVGLDEDFTYLNNRRRGYDVDDMKDRFDLKFRNAVHDRLGVLANDLVSSRFLDVQGRCVYCVEVLPSAELVKFERQAYVRQGTSKWLIPPEKEAAFKRQRAEILQRSKQA